jgi:hypothetical protein
VVELFARDYVNECFWALASTVEGLRYRYLVGDGSPIRSRRNRGVASDIQVDLQQVLRLLDELMEEAHHRHKVAETAPLPPRATRR